MVQLARFNGSTSAIPSIDSSPFSPPLKKAVPKDSPNEFDTPKMDINANPLSFLSCLPFLLHFRAMISQKHGMSLENHAILLENHAILLENHAILLENHGILFQNHGILL